MTQTYKGYVLRPTRTGFAVYYPSCFLNPLYRAATAEECAHWVDAYRDGKQWAVNEMCTERRS